MPDVVPQPGTQLLSAPSIEVAPLRLASTAAAAPGRGTAPSLSALSHSVRGREGCNDTGVTMKKMQDGGECMKRYGVLGQHLGHHTDVDY